MADLDPAIQALLEAPNFIHVATLLEDGSPHSVAVWGGLHRDGRPCFFTQPASLKARNLAHDPRVAISLVDRDDPYRTARVRGRVGAVLEGDEALEVIDALSRKFTGNDFPMRSGVVFLVDVEKAGLMELPFRDEPPAA